MVKTSRIFLERKIPEGEINPCNKNPRSWLEGTEYQPLPLYWSSPCNCFAYLIPESLLESGFSMLLSLENIAIHLKNDTAMLTIFTMIWNISFLFPKDILRTTGNGKLHIQIWRSACTEIWIHYRVHTSSEFCQTQNSFYLWLNRLELPTYIWWSCCLPNSKRSTWLISPLYM